MKASLFLVMGIAVVLGGCITIGSGANFRPDGLPKQEYYVGGGVDISYRATERGTAFVVEENSGKLIKTETVTRNSVFQFHIDPIDEDIHMGMKTLGIDPLNVKFNLYFVPDELEAENGE